MEKGSSDEDVSGFSIDSEDCSHEKIEIINNRYVCIFCGQVMPDCLFTEPYNY